MNQLNLDAIAPANGAEETPESVFKLIRFHFSLLLDRCVVAADAGMIEAEMLQMIGRHFRRAALPSVRQKFGLAIRYIYECQHSEKRIRCLQNWPYTHEEWLLEMKARGFEVSNL